MANSKHVNRTELSLIFGKNVSTIDQWIRQGMPYIEKGSKGTGWIFDTSKAISWREDKLKDEVFSPERIELDEAKRRKIAAEAAILEIELQSKRRAVLSREEVEQSLTHTFITLKQRLRTIPERLAPQILNENDEQGVRELLLNEIDDALLELSQLDFNASSCQ
jgi:phage terminase Nu1 subunit (DNA packaging protein)